MVVDEDEATIVVDVGSSSVKAGFSGEDMPRVVFPSVAEDLHLSSEELSSYRARRPEVRGTIMHPCYDLAYPVVRYLSAFVYGCESRPLAYWRWEGLSLS